MCVGAEFGERKVTAVAVEIVFFEGFSRGFREKCVSSNWKASVRSVNFLRRNSVCDWEFVMLLWS